MTAWGNAYSLRWVYLLWALTLGMSGALEHFPKLWQGDKAESWLTSFLNCRKACWQPVWFPWAFSLSVPTAGLQCQACGIQPEEGAATHILIGYMYMYIVKSLYGWFRTYKRKICILRPPLPFTDSEHAWLCWYVMLYSHSWCKHL